VIINNIEISNFLSFGEKTRIDGFSRYNLFIGENGSGKTNCLKIISGLNLEYIKLDRTDNVNYTASIPYKYSNRDIHLTDIPCELNIEYSRYSYPNKFTKNKIEFSSYRLNSAAATLTSGNIEEYYSFVHLVNRPKTDLSFFKELSVKSENFQFPLLNYGLYYIFNKDYRFSKDGSFMQGDALTIIPLGTTERDYEKLPSGVYECAKLLLPFLTIKSKPVRLIDEPEKSLEPRILKKFFHFIIWLTSRNKQDKSNYECEIFEKVNTHFETSLTRFKRNKDEYIDKQEPNGIRILQLFISTHSSMLINEVLKLSPHSSIYSFKKEIKSFKKKEEYKKFHPEDWKILNSRPWEHVEHHFKERAFFSEVKKLETRKDCLEILRNLGCNGADILQTNGIIWVEGPSDVIYIKKWLEIYSKEEGKQMLIQGIDFEFQMFGGTLLDSLCLIKMGHDEEEEYKKLVSMFSFSRNAFVVIDSDAIVKGDKGVFDQSKFKNAKEFIKTQFNELSKDSSNALGIWYKEGNTSIRTLEDYLDNKSKKMIKENSWTKKIAAQKVTESWEEEKKLDDFPNDLNKEIKILYNVVSKWNK